MSALSGLTKKDIVQEVSKLSLPLGEYVVVGGAILAVHGIRTTSDIDIVATPRILEQCKNEGWESAPRPTGEAGWKKGCIEVYPDVNSGHHRPETPALIKRADMIDGIPFASLNDLLEWKKAYGREKDKQDIELITQHLHHG